MNFASIRSFIRSSHAAKKDDRVQNGRSDLTQVRCQVAMQLEAKLFSPNHQNADLQLASSASPPTALTVVGASSGTINKGGRKDISDILHLDQGRMPSFHSLIPCISIHPCMPSAALFCLAAKSASKIINSRTEQAARPPC